MAAHLDHLEHEVELAFDGLDDGAVREEDRRRPPPARRDATVDDAKADAVHQDRRHGLAEDQHRRLPAVVEELVARAVANRHDGLHGEDEGVIEVADADVALGRHGPPDEREEDRDDEVRQDQDGQDPPEWRLDDRVEDVSRKKIFGFILAANLQLALGLARRVRPVHEPVLRAQLLRLVVRRVVVRRVVVRRVVVRIIEEDAREPSWVACETPAPQRVLAPQEEGGRCGAGRRAVAGVLPMTRVRGGRVLGHAPPAR
mmetsp:Transcript_16166/g.50104  ORF Transcript_16166/g.50104 Transcript_16166/m.50104 type:complete len:258 (+) Transcript_16166:240-1013(+)